VAMLSAGNGTGAQSEGSMPRERHVRDKARFIEVEGSFS
jgi:hypothetical protein